MSKEAFLLLYSGPQDTHAVPFSSWSRCIQAFQTVALQNGLHINPVHDQSERTAYTKDPSADIQWLRAYREVMQ